MAFSVLIVFVAASGLAAVETPGNVNLVKNPSFEETAGGGRNETLVPGWSVRFRAKETERALSAKEVSVVEDPAQAHSGTRCLRLSPRTRSIELQSPVNPLCNLYNEEDLPASPFRTDDWPLAGLAP